MNDLPDGWPEAERCDERRRGIRARLIFAVVLLSIPVLTTARPWQSLVSGAAEPLPASAPVLGGRALFLKHCATCHGADARGDEGPDLHERRLSEKEILSLLAKGVKGEMPNFAKKLSERERVRIADYVRTLAQ